MKLSQLLWQALFIGATPLTLAAAKGKGRKNKPSKPKPTPRRAKSARKPVPASRKPARAAKKNKAAKHTPAAPAKLVAPKPTTPVSPAPNKIEPTPKPAAPTGRAILLSPEGGKFADSVHPRFRWLSVGSATRYQVEWSDRPDFATSHTIASLATEAVVPVEQPLELGVTYYWRVRGGNEGGWGPWSTTASFRVLEATD